MQHINQFGLTMFLQGPYPLCGLAAANNAMEKEEAVTIEHMFSVADELFVIQAQSNGLFSNLMPLRTANGNFNINVVEACILRNGYSFKWVQDNIFAVLNSTPKESTKTVISSLIDHQDRFSLLIKQGRRECT